MENGLSLLESGEAKILGVMVDGLKSDIKRVDDGVKALNDKMDILARLEVLQANNASAISRNEGRINDLDERVDKLEIHRDGSEKVGEQKRWSFSSLVNVSVLLAAIALVLVDWLKR